MAISVGELEINFIWPAKSKGFRESLGVAFLLVSRGTHCSPKRDVLRGMVCVGFRFR